MTKVELFEAIRRDKILHGKSIRMISQERQIHRRVVRQALASAVPPERKGVRREPPVLTRELRALIDEWLLADQTVHRKQRHTARRIWNRLRTEHGFTGAESTVRRVVGQRRRALGASGAAFVPLTHAPGEEAEVDWSEADVLFPWGLTRVQFFQMRACHSGREFNIAFPRQTQQAFLEAHVAAFEYFGGVFKTVRYDNLKSAVTKVLRGRRRVESDRFVALRSHYLYASEFCRPGVIGAHEKGGVEGGVGRFRRNHLVPVPEVEDYSALNRLLLDACARDDLRRIEGRTVSIMEDWLAERDTLLPLPSAAFSTSENGTVRVDNKGCAQVRTNRYSVPIGLVQLRVEYRLHAQHLDFVHGGRVVARHPRLHNRHGIRLELDHYLELLWHKPGALSRSLPLRQARTRGAWPDAYDRLWKSLSARFDETESARQMLSVLMMHREHTPDEVCTAVELAMEHGCHDPGAISVLIRQLTSDDSTTPPLTGLGVLAKYDRPVATLNDYDQLLTRSPSEALH
jgi:transposase